VMRTIMASTSTAVLSSTGWSCRSSACSAHMLSEGPHLQPEGPHLQPEGPHLQPEGPHSQPEGPPLQSEGPHLQPEGPQATLFGNGMLAKFCDDAYKLARCSRHIGWQFSSTGGDVAKSNRKQTCERMMTAYTDQQWLASLHLASPTHGAAT